MYCIKENDIISHVLTTILERSYDFHTSQSCTSTRFVQTDEIIPLPFRTFATFRILECTKIQSEGKNDTRSGFIEHEVKIGFIIP